MRLRHLQKHGLVLSAGTYFFCLLPEISTTPLLSRKIYLNATALLSILHIFEKNILILFYDGEKDLGDL